MKKPVLIAMLFWLGVSSFAQPSAGKIFIGGNLGLYTVVDKTKTEGTTQINSTDHYITVLPMAGYYLSEKMAVGIRTGIDIQIYKTPDAFMDKEVMSTFVINPFGRYYLIAGTGGLFAEASVYTGIGSDKEYFEADSFKQNLLTFSAGVSPGVYYYITSKLSLEAKFGWLGYETDVTKDGDTKEITNFFGLSISPDTFTFGLTYTL